jgi:hypothetical protein
VQQNRRECACANSGCKGQDPILLHDDVCSPIGAALGHREIGRVDLVDSGEK